MLAKDSEQAISAGVNLMLYAGTMAAICQLQALSPVGRCKTFDESADGYGRGEGLASIVLQSFKGDNAATAIICGSAANQVSNKMQHVFCDTYRMVWLCVRPHMRSTFICVYMSYGAKAMDLVGKYP